MAVDEATATRRGRMLLDSGYEAGMVFFNPNHKGSGPGGGEFTGPGGGSGEYSAGHGAAELRYAHTGLGGHVTRHDVRITREGGGFHVHHERTADPLLGGKPRVKESHHADAASVNRYLRKIGGKGAAQFRPEHLDG